MFNKKKIKEPSKLCQMIDNALYSCYKAVLLAQVDINPTKLAETEQALTLASQARKYDLRNVTRHVVTR